MLLNDALNQIIDDGIEAARSDYAAPRNKLKLDGALRGFEECRGRAPAEILALMVEAGETTVQRAPQEETR